MNTRTAALFAIAAVVFFSVEAVEITVDLSEEHQTIDGMGWTGPWARKSGTSYSVDSATAWRVRNNMTVTREAMPLWAWESTNDNGDPFTFNWDGFNTTNPDAVNGWKRYQYLKQHNVVIVLGIWLGPKFDSMARDRDEFIESIAAYLLHTKNEYGVEIDYIDINETDWGVEIRLSPEEYAEIINKSAPRFKELGITTKWHCGSTSHAFNGRFGSNLEYCKKIVELSGEYGAQPAFHGYHSTSKPDSLFTIWGEWQKTLDRNIWCTENDFDYKLWENPDNAKWMGAEETARLMWRVIYLARASVSVAWFHYTENPVAMVHKAYVNHYDPGGIIVETGQPDPDIMSMAYKHHAKNKFVITLLNRSNEAKDVTLTGIPDQTLTHRRTSGDNDVEEDVEIGTHSVSGSTLTMSLKANSFNVLFGKLGAVSTGTLSPSFSPAAQPSRMHRTQVEYFLLNGKRVDTGIRNTPSSNGNFIVQSTMSRE
jgi:hypothetical protein